MKNRIKIPFNKPALAGSELRYMTDAVRRGQLSGDGYYTERCQRWLESYLGRGRVLLTPSGTHALELAALLANLKPGDEVLLPTFTFPSTANAFVLRGAVPRFIDCRPDTLNFDERQLSARVTRRTRVICPVHYGGVVCDMEQVSAAALKQDCVVVEDAAHALGARYRNRAAGTFGAVNALSFHETKNVTCGEGGAVVITDPKWVARAEIIRQKGTNRAAFYRGEVDKYSWVDIGSSYVPSELQAAFLFSQLRNFSTVQRRRREIFRRYQVALQPFEKRGDVRLPVVPPHVQSAYHLFYLLCDTPRTRDRLIERLKARGVLAIFHYVPLHLSPMGRRFGYRRGMFPVAEQAADRLIRLPFYSSLTERDQAYVLNVLRQSL